MTHYEKLVLFRLQCLYADKLSPVKPAMIFSVIPKNERLVWGWLNSLQKKGHVARIGARRGGGWMPTTLPAGIAAGML